MSSLATFECYGKSWVAEQEYGESKRHLEIAAAAHYNRTPYCRKHLLSLRLNGDPLLPEFKNLLKEIKFDLSSDFDTLVIQHDLGQDPGEELRRLQSYGEQVIARGGAIPDFAYLENLTKIGSNFGFNNSNLTLSEINDLNIARGAFTRMLLDRHHD
jgi:hypothetical protein